MKKAQVSLYIIIGLVLAALIGVSYVLKDKVFTSGWEKEQQQSLSIPEKAKNVKLYTESCLQETLTEGVMLMANQGGYITPPEDFLPPSPFNHFSNSLDLFNSGSPRVAYWFYETANGVAKSQIPTKESMQQEIENYITTNAEECLNDFSLLTQQGYDITSGRMVPRVEIANDKIYLTVDYPVRLKHADFTYTLNKFYASMDHSLGKMFDQAVNIIQTENTKNFLEQYALDVLAIYKEIPFSGIDFECAPKTWKRTDVINTIRNAFAANIPMIKIEGTSYTLSNDFNKYFVVETDEVYSDLTTQFTYSPDWPLLVDILDENGPVLQGKPYTTNNAMSKFLGQFFCLNEYHFVYDMKFPVLITLTDKNDNTFQFATMVIIDNNQPRQNQLSISTPDTSSPVCEQRTVPMKIAPVSYSADGSLVSVRDAHVSLQCGAAVCSLGTTDASGILSTTAPPCVNGNLIVERQGFYRGEELITTVEESTASPILEPIYNLNVKVMVIDSNNVRPLQPTEQALFTFTERDKDYTVSTVSTAPSVSLVAGSYEITSSLIVNSEPPFKIPEQNIKVCNDLPKEGVLGIVGLTEKKCVTQKIDATELPQVASGGATISWSTTRQQLASSKTVTLYVVRSAMPKTIQDITLTDKQKAENAKKTKEPTLE